MKKLSGLDKASAALKRAVLSGLAAVALPIGLANAEGGEVIVHVGTGDWAEANVKAYVEPFEKETGIDVVPVEGWFAFSELKLWQESGRSEVDVTSIFVTDGALADKKGWLEPVDYAAFGEDIRKGLTEDAQKPWGVGALYYAVTLAYFSDAEKAPSNWSQFWDIEGYPGKRTMRSGKYGVGGLWEIALLADGVAPEALYPIDFERATKSLDKIRQHIVKWWDDGSDNQQLFADRFVDMGPAFNGRIGNLQKKGMDLTIEWNQALAMIDYWAIPKGSKNPKNAQKFLQFVVRPDRQADFASRISYGPTNLDAYDYLDGELAKQLPSHPSILNRMITVNGDWYAESAGEKTNLDIAVEHWTKWRLK